MRAPGQKLISRNGRFWREADIRIGDPRRLFGKTDTEIEQILAQRKVDSTLLVPSPISGRIVARNAAPGFLTQPGNAPAPYSVADLSTMWMIANVIETDAPAYRLGQEVEVKVPAYPDAVFHGHVTTVGSIIDPNNGRRGARRIHESDDAEQLSPGWHLPNGQGGRPTTVVTPDLRVKGIDGLRVMDASIMPRIISANTNATVMAVADKGVDLLTGTYTGRVADAQ